MAASKKLLFSVSMIVIVELNVILKFNILVVKKHLNKGNFTSLKGYHFRSFVF